MTKIHRVFISHTSEFTKYPEKRSFIDAAIAAVNRAGCLPYDMGYFTARDEKPAEYCKKCVRECDVYVGIIGLRYGSPVRDRPDVSYTELEFEAATEVPGIKRFIFLLDPEASVPLGRFMDMKYGDRQERFRRRLSDAGVTCKPFSDAHELEKLIYQALKEDEEERGESSTREVRIDWPEGTSPYPGLEWFDEKYAPLFFGRDREVGELVGKLSDPGGRMLVISGASGSGKSSLVAAGLWKALIKEGRLPGSQHWRWLRITPAADSRGPFASLAAGLHHAFPKMTVRADDLAVTLANDATAFRTHALTQMTNDQELLLFVDQLEELFTQVSPSAEIKSFLAHLVTISGDLQNRLRVVATIRSEFFGRLAESEDVRLKINEGFHVLVGPISLMALEEMIQRPAAATDYAFEPQLMETILDDAGKEPGNLPLVAYALKQLFEQRERESKTFTRTAYKGMGGVAGAIGTKADQVMERLGDKAWAAFDRVFAELMHIERDRPSTRKRASLSRFNNDDEATKVIQVLAGPECRVLVTAGEELGATVEVAHEKLFTAWPKLKDWIDKSGEDLRLIDYAEEAAAHWHKTGCKLPELWRQEQIESIQRALTRFKKTASDRLNAFMQPQEMLIARLKHTSLSHQDRLLVGQKLADVGDTRPGVGLRMDGLPDIVWISIHGGRVKLEGIDHVFEVKPFYIAKYPVTNAQFQAFVSADDGYRNEEWWGDMEKSEAAAEDVSQESNIPRDTASWYEAVAFCRWLSHKARLLIRLPTEWEWQQAAMGGDPMRDYPWLGEWDASRCNSNEAQLGEPTAVGMYPAGATSDGVLDMAGNLWEWCLNKYDDPTTQEALSVDESYERRVIRGGSYNNGRQYLKVSTRSLSDISPNALAYSR